MQQATDLSTMASLQPTHSADIESNLRKNAARLQGSLRLNLRTPRRDPESSRKYVSGDPVHLIDWKAFARSDQLIVREKREEATGRIRIICEVGSSMQWPPASPGEHLPTKLEIALRIICNLAHLHLKIGDQVIVQLVRQPQEKETMRWFRPQAASDIVGFFDNCESQRFTGDLWQGLLPAAPTGSNNSDLTYLVGDLFAPLSSFQPLLAKARSLQVLQTLSSRELDILWIDDGTCYFPSEGSGKDFLGRILRPTYGNQLAGWLASLKQQLANQQVAHGLFSETTPIHQYVHHIASTLAPRLP